MLEELKSGVTAHMKNELEIMLMITKLDEKDERNSINGSSNIHILWMIEF
jgi:hypothetical protein